MHVVVEEDNKLTFIDYFIALFYKVASIIDLLEYVKILCGWIQMCSHVIKKYEVRGGDGSVLSA